MFFRNLDDFRVAHERGAAAQRPVGFNDNAVLFAVGVDGLCRQQRVALDLVDCGNNFGVGKEGLEVCDRVVGNANGLGFARLVDLFKLFPVGDQVKAGIQRVAFGHRLLVVPRVLVPDRPVHQQEVDVLEAEVSQRQLQALGHVLVVRHVHFCADENVAAAHFACRDGGADAFAHLCFVLVHKRGVQVADGCFGERVLDDFGAFARLVGFVGAEGNGGHFCARVELDCRNGHVCDQSW